MVTLAQLQRPGRSEGTSSLPLRVQHTRTFDTPEFHGMTFLEVEAKSALNRVRGMPFEWSINPYRGCSHACSYCLLGDTPILLADGRTRPIAALAVGDAVYGTVRQGRYRRYTVTRVLDHWSSLKPAYRVRLEDGTQLISSGDHRFLSERGWKHVAGADQGRSRRPHLTTNNKLMGTGAFVPPPKPTEAYERGYLCGMIRGDGHVGSYAHPWGDVHRFRLTLTDDQALRRTSDYLLAHGVPTSQCLFQKRPPGHERATAIRTRSRAGAERVQRLIEWPMTPSSDWCKGFLAGIYDAEGSYSRGILRIPNDDSAVLAWITACLRRFSFSFAEEGRVEQCSVVRLRGGLPEHLRFLHLTDPAITRKRTITGQAIKDTAALRVVEIEPLHVDLPMFDITTETGDFIADGVVSHNCFARPTHRYLNLSPLGDFERTIVVKTNVVAVLRRELARRTWRGDHVAMGTNTDPYQRAEGRYRLMPGIIDALATAHTPFSILTKGTLITRDVAALREAANTVPVTAALTIGMVDERLWRVSEPGTPSPRARLDAVRTLSDSGIPTGVMLAPIMPGLNDDRQQLETLIDAAAAAGAVSITPIVLHLRPGVRELFLPWLEATFPDLLPRYRALYRSSEASRQYRDAVLAFVAERRRVAWSRHGQRQPRTRLRPTDSPPSRQGDGADATRGQQLPLW